MTFIDHLLFLIIAIVFPISSYFSYMALLRRVDAGEQVDRTKLYMQTAAGHWVLFGATMALWIGADRSWEALGFGWQTDKLFFAGVALTLVVIGFLWGQARQVSNSNAKDLARFRQQFGRADLLVPRNGNELGRFYGLALTAGIVEEVLWRGFLIWYLGYFMPLWAAAVLSTVGFGVAHSYQGVANVPKITIVGAAFTGIYLLTGSLWIPMILHTVIDVIQGKLGYEVVRLTNDNDIAENDAAVLET